jgi:uncharacterized protein (TIGR00369 family)
MSTLLERLAAARAANDVSKLADAIPYASWMGMAPENTTGELLTRMRYSPQLIGNTNLPALHGGTIGALLETAAIFHLLWEMENAALPRIINITVDYLRSGRPVDTVARASFTKLGRRVASVAVEAWQDDRSKPVSAAQLHFLVTPLKK